jgi:ABC-2 type transport system ATP-binding protein
MKGKDKMRIEIRNYTKILGKQKVLENINYIFESGKIYGIYGRNGSGKSMLLRAISGLIFPTEGTVEIDDKILHRDISFPESVGLIIDKTELLPEYDAFTNLKILSKINKIATDDDIINAIKIVGLDPKSKKKVRQFSMGMKQKLSIAQAIFETPKLLLLDEPTNALDLESVDELRKMLLSIRKSGCLILITSHNQEDIRILSDEQINIESGRIVNL